MTNIVYIVGVIVIVVAVLSFFGLRRKRFKEYLGAVRKLSSTLRVFAYYLPR